MILQRYSLAFILSVLYGISHLPLQAQQPVIIQSIAGGGARGDGGWAVRAQLSSPENLTVDASGNLYFHDQGSARIKKVDRNGIITTVAGSGLGDSGILSYINRGLPLFGSNALNYSLEHQTNAYIFAGPTVDSQENIYFILYMWNDSAPLRLLKVDGNRRLSLLSLPLSLSSMAVYDIETDSSGNFYLVLHSQSGQSGQSHIYKISPNGAVTLLGGNDMYHCAQETLPCGEGMEATKVWMNTRQIEVSSNGIIYFIDWPYIRKIDANGRLRTIAGQGHDRISENIPAILATLEVKDIAVNAQEEVYLSEHARVRKIDRNGFIYTVAGKYDKAGFSGEGGPAIDAMITPGDIAVDTGGHLFIADVAAQRILKVNKEGHIYTYAGGGGGDLLAGDGGPAFGVRLKPKDVAIDAQNNIYVADENWIRKIGPTGQIFTVAGRSSPHFGPEGPILFSGDNGPALEAQLNQPNGITLDTAGNLYIADTKNHRIRKVGVNGIIQTIAGNGKPGFSGDGGPATRASLYSPHNITLDGEGNLYISDTNNFRVRKVTPDGIIRTVAGNGASIIPAPGLRVGVFSGDGGPAHEAGLTLPMDVAVDSQGNLYIADSELIQQTSAYPNCTKFCYDIYKTYGSHRIRRVDRQGIITTVAGGTKGEHNQNRPEFQPYGDNGPALSAFLGHVPYGLAIDSSDNLYISVQEGFIIWKMTPDQILHAVAGRGPVGYKMFSNIPYGSLIGEGGPAIEAALNHPLGITIDLNGNLLIADADNQRLRKVYSVGSPGIIRDMPSEMVLLGDVSRDYRVDISDAILILQSLVSAITLNDFQKRSADVNVDEQIDVQDVILILQVGLRLRPDFEDHLPRSDGFTSGLDPIWRVKQVRGALPLPLPYSEAKSGRLSLTSANYDVWMGIWDPYFLYQDGLYGDFTMQVKVESVPACHDLSGVGLMVAQNVPDRIAAPEAIPRWGLVHATSGLGVEAKWGGQGTSQSSLAEVRDPNLKPPYWLRLDRQGSTLSFFTSTDGGKSWIPVVAPVNLEARGWALRDPIAAGIVQQTHCEATTGTAVVSNFQAGPITMVGKLPGDAAP